MCIIVVCLKELVLELHGCFVKRDSKLHGKHQTALIKKKKIGHCILKIMKTG